MSSLVHREGGGSIIARREPSFTLLFFFNFIVLRLVIPKSRSVIFAFFTTSIGTRTSIPAPRETCRAEPHPLLQCSSPHHHAMETLQSIFPDSPITTLSRYLTASNGNVERATLALLDAETTGRDTIVSSSSKRRRVYDDTDGRGKGRGGTLEGWIRKGKGKGKGKEKEEEGTKELESDISSSNSCSTNMSSLPLKSAFPLLLASALSISTSSASTPPARTPTRPLILSTAALVASGTDSHCTLHESILPKSLAERLFKRMFVEQRGEDGGKGCEF